MNPKVIPTGNEYLSLPEINENDASISGLSVLYMRYKGLIELRGDENTPLFTPFIIVDNREIPLENLKWQLLNHWVPMFTAKVQGLTVEGVILTPVGERGFVYRLTVKNTSEMVLNVAVCLKGLWRYALHEINETKEISAVKRVYNSNWNHTMLFELQGETGILALAPIFSQPVMAEYETNATGGIAYRLIADTVSLEKGSSCSVDFYWGVGFEEVSAATSAKEIMRRGYEYELNKTLGWLKQREKVIPDAYLCRILNRNMFFNFFYASGITIDTEELTLMTSRSPRYYVSAAYWDRDSLLWSFPSILLADSVYAREILLYVFSRQIRNIGIHSRYIDGTLLEPGFELDELCAPIIALYGYINKTKDTALLTVPCVQNGVRFILKRLAEMKHPAVSLYETFLQPTDDEIVYPYITYDNVLVWSLFENLAQLYKGIWAEEETNTLAQNAIKVREAIYKHCVKEYRGKRIFAWSVDLNGKWDVYDEPPGSLQLLPHYGFCGSEDEVYKNTVTVLRDPEYAYSFSGCNIAEIGCPHAPHPWVLSIANSLLCGRLEQCRDILLKTSLDNGIACESVHETTGECTSGEAFATCAGFLAYAIHTAYQ